MSFHTRQYIQINFICHIVLQSSFMNPGELVFPSDFLPNNSNGLELTSGYSPLHIDCRNKLYMALSDYGLLFYVGDVYFYTVFPLFFISLNYLRLLSLRGFHLVSASVQRPNKITLKEQDGTKFALNIVKSRLR
jgi:hypothetical protein